MNTRTVLSSPLLAPPPPLQINKAYIEEKNTSTFNSPTKSAMTPEQIQTQANHSMSRQSISIIDPNSCPGLQSPVPTPINSLGTPSPHPNYLPPKNALGSILAGNINISTNISTNINMNINTNINKSRLTPIIGSPLSGLTLSDTPSALKCNVIKECSSNEDDHDDSSIDKITTAMSTAMSTADVSLTAEKPSAALMAKSQSPMWLPSYLHRALSLGVVPRLHSADAGTSSASIFTDRLLEDTFIVRTDCDEIKRFNLRGFEGFLRSVIITASTEL